MRGFIFIVLLITGLFLNSCSEKTRFVLLDPEETGITFCNTVAFSDSFNVITHEYIYNGGGAGIGDLNNDGLPDVVFAGNQVSPKIYLNKGNFRFEEITGNFMGLTSDRWFSGVAIADINNDGWSDVYFSIAAGHSPADRKNQLWINRGIREKGIPEFAEMAEVFGVADSGHSVQSAFLDYDNDGDPDLYVMNNLYAHNDTIRKKVPSMYRPKITDGSAITNDRLYRNNGDGSFTDVTQAAGVVVEGFGLGIAVGDINKDGYPDLYISNDYLPNDVLYMNQGNGTFRNEIGKLLSYQTKSSMGNDMADATNDGYPEIITLDMLPEPIYRKKQTINGFGYIYHQYDAKFGYEHQYLRNMFHLHNGLLGRDLVPFSEIGQLLKIEATEWSWSPLFADFDNDGDRDLFITNGYPADITDKDWSFYKMKALNIFSSLEDVLRMAVEVRVPNKAFENNGNLRFSDQTGRWLPSVPSFSNGAAFADLDNDGDLDYLTNNLNDTAFIYKNLTVEQSNGKAHHLKIKLQGAINNRQAIGATVETWSQGNYRYYEHFLSRGYASSMDPVIHFGLGTADLIDSLKITWPAGGGRTVLKEINANQTLVIIQEAMAESFTAGKETSDTGLLFYPCDSLISFEHLQDDFDDFSHTQVTIPHKFSQIGPVMAKGDLDGDGLEDILTGSSNRMPTRAFLNRGNKFEEAEIEGLTYRKKLNEAALAILDTDNDGDNDVVALAGGYENSEDKEYRHILYENKTGKFTGKLLPVPGFPASVVVTFDYDHDGFTDLFIGSRIKRGAFPLAHPSWLLKNNNGSFSGEKAVAFDLGMVTDALWSDVDNDGWEDLLIAREWNSIVALKNRQGKTLEPVSLPGLSEFHGLWYSLAKADVDLDGDEDYLAGNLGDNHRFTVSRRYPMSLKAVDFDLDGRLDPVVSAFWKDPDNKMKEYPVNYLDELAAQSPWFKRNFNDYTSFSHAGTNQIFDKEVRKRMVAELFVNTTSSYLIRNNGGSFSLEKLPMEVQFAPVKKMVVRDLNCDNYPDVIIAGNDHTHDVATGIMDAGKGIVLINKEAGSSFEPLLPAASGLLLRGMVESLILLEGDDPILLAGINRGKMAAYRIKKR